MKRWQLSPFDKTAAVALARDAGLPPLLGALLLGRGCATPQQAHAMLDSGSFADPLLMKDMDKAVSRLRRALDDFEKIAVYGDYDADGVTATAILFTYLRDQGAKVSFYIPQRGSEGYGLNMAAVDTLNREGVDLIVTVDNGVSAVKEIAYAKKLGMDVIVTDHHQPQEQLPQAAALVNAHQPGDESPYKELSGAGVAFKLLIAMEGGGPEAVERVEKYADLAAVGTVGDSVPLTGENRLIVQTGLRQIDKRRRPGLDAILDPGSGKTDAGKLAFTAVPCINATGRMGAPERAVRLLTYQDSASAQALAQELKGDNARRKQVEQEIFQAAAAKIEGDSELRFARVILVEGSDWHMGVVGIVASKIVERFGKPCFVLSAQEDGCYRGSGRSVEGFDLFQAVHACRALLERYGGHPMAAGLTVPAENLPELRRQINRFAAEACPDVPVLTLRLDCPLKPSAVTARTAASLAPLEPFGAGNPQPLFGLYGVTLRGVRSLGSTGAHCRLQCEKDGFAFECVYFRMRAADLPFEPGTVVDLAVNLQVNDYPRGRGFDFLVRDVKRSSLDVEACIAGQRLYEKHRRGEPLTQEEARALTPSREEFGALYRLLARPGPRPVRDPLALLSRLEGSSLDLGRLQAALDVLEERGLIENREGRWEALPQREKAELAASPCMPQAAGDGNEEQETRRRSHAGSQTD